MPEFTTFPDTLRGVADKDEDRHSSTVDNDSLMLERWVVHSPTTSARRNLRNMPIRVVVQGVLRSRIASIQTMS